MSDETKDYRKPTGAKLGHERLTRELYNIEDSVFYSIQAAVNEYGKVRKFTKEQFYTHSLPEELLTILDHYDPKASAMAAIAFLEREGYKITKE